MTRHNACRPLSLIAHRLAVACVALCLSAGCGDPVSPASSENDVMEYSGWAYDGEGLTVIEQRLPGRILMQAESALTSLGGSRYDDGLGNLVVFGAFTSSDDDGDYALTFVKEGGVELALDFDGDRSVDVLFDVTPEGHLSVIGKPELEWEIDCIGRSMIAGEEPLSAVEACLGSPIERSGTAGGSTLGGASTTVRDERPVFDTAELMNTNVPPVVDIIEPNGSHAFCTGESISFLATSRDRNNTPTFELPESAIEWSVAGGSAFGTGHSATTTLTEGAYTIVVRATDEQGESAEDLVDLRVEACPNQPPKPLFLAPSASFGPNDELYVYKGYDEARGQWFADVTLAGVGDDEEDGRLIDEDSLVWTTNRTDLQLANLGAGYLVSNARLYSDTCSGTRHEVSLTVTDSHGQSRTATRIIRIWTLC